MRPPSFSLVADSKTKDVTKSTTTYPEANVAEDDGVDVAAGASDPHSGNFGRNPCPASAGAAEKDTGEDDNGTKPRNTTTRWKLRFKLKIDQE